MWILPTLNRIEKLKTMLKSAVEMETSTPAIIAIDTEDYLANQSAYLELEKGYAPENWKIHVTSARSMGGKVRELFSRVKDQKWIGLLNDDFEFASKGWDKALISRLDGKNFVSANDRSVNAFRLPVTATAWSMPLLEAINWPIYPPDMEHLFIDNLWRDIGKTAGCWRVVPQALVLHKHVLWGQAKPDETHEKVYNQERWQADERVYLNIVQNQAVFTDLIQKIKSLQGDQRNAWNPEVRKKHDPLMAP